jgi:phosphoheptose isomerase
MEEAHSIGMKTVLLTGEKGRRAEIGATWKIIVPELATARVQEVHIFLLHMLAAGVEKELGLS